MTLQLLEEIRTLILNHFGFNAKSTTGSVQIAGNSDLIIHDVQLFCNQLEDKSLQIPLILVSFGKLEFSEIAEKVWRSPLTVELLIVNSRISPRMKFNHLQHLAEHESIVDSCIKLLHNKLFASICEPMILKFMEINYDYQGYMTTSLQFNTYVQI